MPHSGPFFSPLGPSCAKLAGLGSLRKAPSPGSEGAAINPPGAHAPRSSRPTRRATRRGGAPRVCHGEDGGPFDLRRPSKRSPPRTHKTQAAPKDADSSWQQVSADLAPFAMPSLAALKTRQNLEGDFWGLLQKKANPKIHLEANTTSMDFFGVSSVSMDS